MPEAAAACRVCRAPVLEDLGTVGVRPSSVLSDSRLCPRPARILRCRTCGLLQKLPTSDDAAAIRELYARYRAHHLSNGDEQPAFVAGREPTARSRIALERCRERLPARGRLLDFGCGNGAALVSASRVLDGWELHGSDLDEQHRDRVLAIPGAVGFHSGADAIPAGIEFDLIVLWHVLEHLDEPVSVLERLKRALRPGGRVLLAVPDVERTPFDLAVLDHVAHFSRATLATVLAGAGLDDVVVGGDEWVHNCLAGLHREGGSRAATPPRRPAPGGAPQVAWLNEVVRSFDDRAARGDYALFGAGMSSIWLVGQLSRRPAFLLDEDPAKRGSSFDGIPIRSPHEIDRPVDVLMPFSSGNARRIAERLRAAAAATTLCNFVIPEVPRS